MYVIFPVFQKWGLGPFIVKKAMFNGHLFSSETAYDRFSTHIINQAIINSVIRN
jgi:hypothetical protein